MDSPTPISGMSPSSALQFSSSESIPRPSERSIDLDSIRKRLVLFDQDSGEVLGTIGDQYDIKQHPNVTVDATSLSGEKEAVVVDLPSSDDEDGEVFVQAIPSDEKDMLLKSAKKISASITSITNLLASSMTNLTTYYETHSYPLRNHASSHISELRDMRDHDIDAGGHGQVLKFTKKAVEFVDDRILDAMEYVDHHVHVGSKKGRGGGNGTGAMCRRDSSPMIGTISSSSTSATLKLTLPTRLFISDDLILNTLEDSAGTSSLSDAISYKLGADLGEDSNFVGQSARNAVVVYIDADGVGRNALVRKAGQSFVRARVGWRDEGLGVRGMGEGDGSSLSVHGTRS